MFPSTPTFAARGKQYDALQGDHAEAGIHHPELGVAPGVGEVVLALA